MQEDLGLWVDFSALQLVLQGPERHLLRTDRCPVGEWVEEGWGVNKPCDSSHPWLPEPREGTAVYTLLWNVLLGLSV